MKPAWNTLDSVAKVDALIEASHAKPQLIFKHSTRCNISSLAQYRLEDDWDIDPTQVDPHYLDLIRYRDVSNYIAERLSVYHESPQVILVKDGECTYEESHMGIYVAEIKEQLV